MVRRVAPSGMRLRRVVRACGSSGAARCAERFVKTMKNRQVKEIVWTAAGIAFLLLLWVVISALVGNDLLFPSPAETFGALGRLAGTAEFYLSVAGSLLSVAAGFIGGNIIGVVLGLASGLSSRVNAFVKPGMAVIKATPVASFIILVLIWLGKAYTPALTAFLIVLPVVWQNVVAGIRSADRGLLEVATVFNFSFGKKLKYVYLPAAAEGYIAAVRTSMGFAWKAGVAAEVLSGTARTLGGKIYSAKILIETPELFAYTLVVVGVSLLVEVAAASIVQAVAGRKKSEADPANANEEGGAAHE